MAVFRHRAPIDVAQGRQTGLCPLVGSQRSVPLLAQFVHLGVPCVWQAQAVVGTGTEFLDAQRTQLGPRLLEAPPKVGVLIDFAQLDPVAEQ
ncbi:hypothetical protein [Streptomyces sp. enrichment culture]|uniref:hypothetical protein n=1 Tax=Streptomyces sp. enrichment culture TaxID=1795815 RepID=UPI003F57C34C